MSIIQDLTSVIEQRLQADPDSSYVASLHAKGLNKILEKVGEEATEVIIAAKDAAADRELRDALVREVADLWFHSMVLLAEQELSAADVLDELGRRFGIGGLEEKARR